MHGTFTVTIGEDRDENDAQQVDVHSLDGVGAVETVIALLTGAITVAKSLEERGSGLPARRLMDIAYDNARRELLGGDD